MRGIVFHSVLISAILLTITVFVLHFLPKNSFAQTPPYWGVERGTGAGDLNDLKFYLNPSGTAQSPAMYLKSTGDLGLGTTNPRAKLDVFITTNQHMGIGNWNSVPSLLSFNDGFTAWGDMVIAPSGRVGVGMIPTGSNKLDINGTANMTNLTVSGGATVTGALIVTNGGFSISSGGTSRFLELKTRNWSTAGGATMCFGTTAETIQTHPLYTIGACSSDLRLKKNVRYLETPILDQVLKLKPAKFDLKDGTRKDIYGFIAQDVQQVFPETVIDNGPDEMLQFSPEQLVPQLTKAIQELSAKVDAQQAEIERLKQSQLKE